MRAHPGRWARLSAVAVAACLAAALAGPAPPSGAAFPGVNGRIAFNRLPAPPATPTSFPPSADIFTTGPDGTGPAALTAANSASLDGDPAWSADGTRLAFSSTRTGNAEIYVANADGTGVAQLTDDSRLEIRPADVAPAWSPDGTRIAYSRGSPSGGVIAVIGVNGGAPALITPPGTNARPAWSPDGTRVAFQRQPSTGAAQSDIWTANPDGSNPVNLTPGATLDAEPNWSPDGTRIAYSRDGDIYVMRADGSNPVPVTNDKTTLLDRQPAWSPDGTRIAFTTAAVRAPGRLFTIAPDGSNRLQLTNTTADDTEPDWQPLRPPGASLAPDLDFGSVAVGATGPPLVARLTSTGLSPVTVGPVVVGGAAAGDFLKGPDACTGQVVAPGVSCEITIRFRPTTQGGRSATLTVSDSAPGSPRAVSLRGVGTVTTTSSTPGTTAPAGTAALELVPPVGPPGFVTLAVGRGFAPASRLKLRWDRGLGEREVTVDGAGGFRVPVLIFHRDTLGARRLVATLVAGAPFSPETVGADFLVVPNSIQPGDFVLRR